MVFIAADGTVCRTREIKLWHEEATGIKSPLREMPADAICTNNLAYLTEDEHNWCLVHYDPDKPIEKMSKSYTEYPFALVAKWGFSVVNKKRYEELEREECARQGWDYDKIKAGHDPDDNTD